MVFVETFKCLRISFIPQPPQKDAGFGRECSQPHIGKCNVGGRMWKPLLISALNHPYLLCLGDRPSQANYCTRHGRGARLGRKYAVEEVFPRYGDVFSFMRDPSAAWKGTMETEDRFHGLISLYRHLAQKACC